MKISAVMLFILKALAVNAEAPRPDPSIVKTADAYLKAMLAGDATGVIATYRDDAVEMPPGRAPLKGRVAIQQYFRELFQGPVKITAFTFSYLETVSAGDLGYAAGTYEQKLSGGPAGSIEDTGKFVVILRRTGSAWKAAYVIYNSDRPPGHLNADLLPLPSPQRDVAVLASYYVKLAGVWLALAAASLALIALLMGGWGTISTWLRSLRRTGFSPVLRKSASRFPRRRAGIPGITPPSWSARKSSPIC
jgi:uncharacterized protein (TIGR02246 family)